MSDKKPSSNDTISFKRPPAAASEEDDIWGRTTVPTSAPAPTESPKRKRHPLRWLVLAALVLFVVGPAVHNLFSSDAPAPETSPAPETRTPVETEIETMPDIQATSLNDFDWQSLVGEKLSNAYSVMKYNGIDRDDVAISLVTNDGTRVVAGANWTVESVERKGDALLFHLHHDVTEDGKPPLAIPDGITTDDVGEAATNGLTHLQEGIETATDKLEEFASGQ